MNRIPEHVAYHSYREIPRRASAQRTTTTAVPPASPHRAGFSSGTHPEDCPYTTDEQGEDRDSLYPQRAPSSARRYAPPTQEYAAPTPQEPVLPVKRGHPKAFYTLLVGGSIILGGMLASLIPPVWQRTSDQLTYGYPRTYQTDVNVGHYPKARDPRSHFIALNSHGYIEVIELPEGVPGKGEQPHLYLIALPANAQADLTPVTVSFEDVNGDGKLDMVVTCNNTTTLYYNTGTTFTQQR